MTLEAHRAALRRQHEDRRAERPREHARDAARALGTTEAELVDATPRRAPGARGPGVTPLDPSRLREVFPAFATLGVVKTMTRNEHAVLERWGAFESVEAGPGPLGQVVGTDIDLRLFFDHLASGFAVVEPGRSEGTWRRSVQLFDRQGDSAFKVYLEEQSRVDAFEAIARTLAAPADAAVAVSPPPVPSPPRTIDDGEIDAFREAWDAMTNTHQFFGLLRRFGVGRAQALSIAGPSRARRVDVAAAGHVLDAVAAREQPVMIFVGSRGVLQIHVGPVRRVAIVDGWVNVLDREVNVHLREAGIARAWVVRKPTDDGVVTSLELLGADGEPVALLFSKRKPGQHEVPAWPALLGGLEGA